MKDEELMKQCVELAKQGIDLEKVYKSLSSVFDICKEIMELAIKNYKFMKNIKEKKENE